MTFDGNGDETQTEKEGTGVYVSSGFTDSSEGMNITITRFNCLNYKKGDYGCLKNNLIRNINENPVHSLKITDSNWTDNTASFGLIQLDDPYFKVTLESVTADRTTLTGRGGLVHGTRFLELTVMDSTWSNVSIAYPTVPEAAYFIFSQNTALLNNKIFLKGNTLTLTPTLFSGDLESLKTQSGVNCLYFEDDKEVKMEANSVKNCYGANKG